MRDPFLSFSFPIFSFPPRNKRWENLHHFLLDFFLILFFLPVLLLSFIPIFFTSLLRSRTYTMNEHRETPWIITFHCESFLLLSLLLSLTPSFSNRAGQVIRFGSHGEESTSSFSRFCFLFTHFFFTSILVVRREEKKGSDAKCIWIGYNNPVILLVEKRREKKQERSFFLLAGKKKTRKKERGEKGRMFTNWEKWARKQITTGGIQSYHFSVLLSSSSSISFYLLLPFTEE